MPDAGSGSKKPSNVVRRLIAVGSDVLFIVGLMLYVLIGAPGVPFHPDESMQIYASRDCDVAFQPGGLSSLTTHPPYEIDSDAHLRILNGSVHRYSTGLIRMAAGVGQLPPRPGWNWALDFQGNLAAGFFPKPELLAIGRLSSVLYLALAAIPAWFIGRMLWGRMGSWLFSAFVLLNPAILLNGRRAMQEGSLIFFGLLLLWVGLGICRRILNNPPCRVAQWVAFSACGGLALASKHNALVLLAGTLAAIVAAIAFSPMEPTARLREALKGGLSALGAVILFIGLSPALWNHPPARLADLVQTRSDLIRAIDDGRHSGLVESLQRVVTMPFVAAPQFFEMADWASTPGLAAAIARYESAPWAGLPFPGVPGGIVMALAVWGAFAPLTGRFRNGPGLELPLAAWMLTSSLLLLPNPLPWQRYYLILVLPISALAVLGARQCISLLPMWSNRKK